MGRDEGVGAGLAVTPPPFFIFYLFFFVFFPLLFFVGILHCFRLGGSAWLGGWRSRPETRGRGFLSAESLRRAARAAVRGGCRAPRKFKREESTASPLGPVDGGVVVRTSAGTRVRVCLRARRGPARGAVGGCVLVTERLAWGGRGDAPFRCRPGLAPLPGRRRGRACWDAWVAAGDAGFSGVPFCSCVLSSKPVPFGTLFSS